MTIPLLVHVGYHKTGTTWLQHVVFPREELGFAVPVDSRTVRNGVVLPHPLSFDVAACQAEMCPPIEQARQVGRVPVVSCEALSGEFLSGGYNCAENAQRLAQIFPNAKILIVIREQRSMIRSAYSQYLKSAGTLSARDWLTQNRSAVSQNRGLFSAEFYQYDRLITIYQTLFGRANVLVLPYEQLKTEPLTFVASIMQFCDLNPSQGKLQRVGTTRAYNRSLSPVSLAVRRRVNVLVRWQNRLLVGRKASKPLTNRRIRLLLERLDSILPNGWVERGRDRLDREIAASVPISFRESNRRTAELTGLNLAEWGYDL